MIYYVEDDAGIRELVVYSLNQSGLETKGFDSDRTFRAACEDALPDFVILDIMLPDADGLVTLNRLKNSERTAEIPVIMLTAKGSELDKVKGLDLGADDYIAKPFGIMELISRIRAVSRRIGEKKQPVELASGEILLNTAKHTVVAAGRNVVLTNKEYHLLKFLLENKGYAIGRERLLDAVWGYDYYGSTRTVDVHIQTLRQKLGAAGEQIQTVRGAGYRVED